MQHLKVQGAVPALEQFQRPGNSFQKLFHLYLYDKNFSDVKEINLQGLYNRCKDDGISLSCDDIEIDDEGRIGIISGQSIIFADSNGELLCVIEQQDNIRTFAKLAVTKAQGWYVICNNTKYNIDIWSIDIGQSGLGVRLDNAPDIYGGQVYFVGQNQRRRIVCT